jgi:hypothetical protein
VRGGVRGGRPHDDAIDPRPAAQRLGLGLTPLADTLAHTFAPGNPSA